RAFANRGQLSRVALFNVRDPRLPPVIRTFNTALLDLAGIAKNSRRTGNPVSSNLPRGKNAAVSGKLNSAHFANRPIWRLASPGRAFGSMITIGTPLTHAASVTGPATYPPMLKTADGRCCRISRSDF